MKEDKKSILIASVFIFLVSILRICTLELGGSFPNFTPIGAIALFSGITFRNKWVALALPLSILFLSDIVIQKLYYSEYLEGGLLYRGWYWVYISFLLIVVLGYLLPSQSLQSVILKTILASTLHYVITNFSVWASGGTDITTGLPYTQNWSGLLKSYTLALPFFKNFFAGTLFYMLFMVEGARLVSKVNYSWCKF